MATDCGCHVVSVRVQHGTGVDMLEVAHCPLHAAAPKLLHVAGFLLGLHCGSSENDDRPCEDCLRAREVIKEAEA